MDVKCIKGHRFPDGMREKRVYCRNKKWNEFDVLCTRTYMFVVGLAFRGLSKLEIMTM